MAEKEKGKSAKKTGAKSSGGAAKKAAKKPAAKAKKKATEKEEKKASEEEIPAAQEEEAAPEQPEPEAGAAKEEEMSEEEFRRLVEESLEKVTVADIVLTMMNQLASVGYMKMGLPESVNLKYRDFDQARLAIDTLEAILKGAEGKVAEESLRPFKGTLANLQMNFVQLRR
jgi:hypothetical protein